MQVYVNGVINDDTCIGGWSFVINYDDGESCQMSCSSEKSTSGYMSMIATYRALLYLSQNNINDFTIVTSNKFLFQGITKMLPLWIKNDWKTSNNKDVKYKDLWVDIHHLCTASNAQWRECLIDEPPMIKASLLSTECSQKSQDI